MNILFVSDNFSEGGLETHLNTYFKVLKKHYQIGIFFLSSFKKTPFFKSVDLYADRIFDIEIENYSHASILKLKNKIDEILRYNDINVIHAHPFISIISSFSSAVENDVPFVFTLHGKLSFFSPDNASNLYLRRIIFENSLGFSVNPSIIPSNSNILYLPNPIDTDFWVQRESKDGKYILIVSRLDDDKSTSIEIAVDKLRSIKLPILIVGDGREKERLEKKYGGENIKFLGVKVGEELKGLMEGASIVCGMGRVILESLFLGKITLLINYEGSMTLIGEDNFHESARFNFNGSNFSTEDPGLIDRLKQIIEGGKGYSFDKRLLKSFSSDIVVGRYLYYIKKYKSSFKGYPRSIKNFVRLFEDYSHTVSELEKEKRELTDSNDQINELKKELVTLKNKVIYEKNKNAELMTQNEKLITQNEKFKEEINVLSKNVETLTNALTDIYNSRFWKIATKFYSAKTKMKKLLGIKKKDRNTNTPIAQDEWSKQYRYFLNYLENPNLKEIEKLKAILELKSSKYKGIILYPLSYPLELKQRPEHILQVLAKRGYLVFILSLSSVDSNVKKLKDNLYLTDLVGAIIYLLRDKSVILYFSFYGFYYLSKLFEKYILIYDILDEPSLMSHYDDNSIEIHNELISKADVCIYSSLNLYRKYSERASYALLLENGVNIEDFKLRSDMPRRLPKKDNEIIVGFYGAISELLDFDVLEELLSLNNIRLVLIGPKAPFNLSNKQVLEERFNKLLKFDNFEYIDFVPYEELKFYLNSFDICIIPFVVNDITDSVCPLKLFEFMAARKPIVCSATEELLRYKEYIYIAHDKTEFKNIIKELSYSLKLKKEYDSLLEKHSWDNLVKPFEKKLSEILLTTKSSGRCVSVKDKKIVDILNVNFFDWSGKTLYYGGAERYVTDLAKLIKDFGWDVRIVQNANKYFEKRFKEIKVIGIPARAGWNFEVLFSYYLRNFNSSNYTICSPLDIACISSNKRIIGINHGIYWDETFNRWKNIDLKRHEKILKAVENVDIGVCVDTNFINWVRTYDYKLSEKLTYIPNYFDPKQFKTYNKDFSNREIVVLYPRRLYKPRGFYLVLSVLERMVEIKKNVKFKFVGQADRKEKRVLDEYINRYPNQVEHCVMSLDEMNLAYEDSQIVLIPTVHSEGTSLSCIEAMSTNNAIIATNVGGLPNLIIDGYNGLLIPPKEQELKEALSYLIDNPEKRKELAYNALQISGVFRKELWEKRWRKILQEFLAY